MTTTLEQRQSVKRLPAVHYEQQKSRTPHKLGSLAAQAQTSAVVQRLKALQHAANAGAHPIQRTTAADVNAWQNNEWTPVFTMFNNAINNLNVNPAFDFQDNDELKDKMESVSAQLTGHAFEFDYGSRKINDRQQNAAQQGQPPVWAQNHFAQLGGGGDVMASRRGAVGGTKAVQIKGVSSTKHYQVTNQIRAAAEQLTGMHGEVPGAGWQRIARVIVANPNNPFPFTDNSGNTIAGSTLAQVLHQFDQRTNVNMDWDYVDKIKVVYRQPQTTSDHHTIHNLILTRKNIANKNVSGGQNSAYPQNNLNMIARPANTFTQYWN